VRAKLVSKVGAEAKVVAELVPKVGAGVLTKVITGALAGVGAGVSARFFVEKILPLVRSKLASR